MLPQTPSEVHGRVYDRGILYLHNHTPSHVAATEKLAAEALEQLLKPLSLAEYPTTYGPKDTDPFVPLLEEAKARGNHNDLFPTPKADAATKAVLRGLYEELKKREGRSLADRLKINDRENLHLE
ncbi:uncharacterized protein LOC62_01G000990 [Vanrija pseudolonga]|uniref:Uncharacterized protein n=1 Tax=Vanrija pseudolonga TaxID=143232 RepID=A0AAF1BF17_9TREE|nr:hypothetical protein LOC62_01G000990 [Vanrija pseudolonga]